MDQQLLLLIVHVVVTAITLALGLIVFFNNRKSATNIIFFILSTFILIWMVFNYFAIIHVGSSDLPWARGILFSAAFQVYLLYFFVKSFPRDRLEIKPWELTLVLTLFAGTALLATTPYVFSGMTGVAPGEIIANVEQGKLIPLYGLSMVGIIIASLIVMVQKYRHATALERKQWAFILTGFAIFFVSAVVFLFLVTNLLGTTIFVPYAPITIIPMLIGSVFAILKYRLLNVKVIAAELLTVAIWIGLLVEIVLSASLQEVVLKSLVFIVIVLFGLFLIRSVRREVYDKEQLQELTKQLNIANTELQDLNDNLQAKVDEQTKEIRAAYEVEKKARQKLEELDKAKDQFILTTQHNLRTPLTIIKGYVELVLSKKFGNFDAKVGDYINRVGQSTDRMSKLVNELLDVSQLKVGKSIFNFQPVNFRDLVVDVLNDLKSETSRKGLYIELKEDGSWPMVNVDPAKFKTALFNIFDNAMKYTEEGGITITLTYPRPKDVQLCVSDTGIGMSEETKEKLFSRLFERGVEAERISPIGRGIGLALSYNIIKAHQGNLWAESDGVNKGSRFYIELPIA
ncbi:MAG: hypothetical protein A3H06_00120 [Candidatus Colwellbacteria bacterium RIFCSPLOWO2_12_FULL_44_13]|uniref:histidine kinase n=2 Tax=Candidatus Colwelliibacteriota TaxID=1817904 RepID=A0A1G1ZAT2_9BACT|nr:MAG: hypothetical protein A3I31_02670 [Candidatus Colwellbacteria bacterium RIFCSPLOWO2_02_FULL_44_20b]OGY62021.1 MAG: hypothetical protein A3H06_00120 [Candidatus Colwellbacteria bacterium RIFCSPLOWO2_12_FULL_44_13]